MSARLAVAVVGATGVAGRQALAALAGHPWFDLAAVVSSSRTAGRRLGDVPGPAAPAGREPPDDPLAAAVAALLPPPDPLAGNLADLRLVDGEQFDARSVDVVFSMLPNRVARRLEPRFAVTTPVLSTAAAFRDEPDTPVLLAGVNPDHAALLSRQARRRGWAGFVAPGPNCTTVGLAVTLAPLMARFGVRAASLTSLQAVSGAGGDALRVAAAVAGNVLPYIPGEEEKVEREARKILGRVVGDGVEPAPLAVGATCTRVPVAHGHTLSVSVALSRPAAPGEVAACLAEADPWRGRDLPGAPERWILVDERPERPQPRLDLEHGGGMTTVVGRLREDPVTGGVRYVVLSHNAVLGAAGGAVLLAEDLLDRGLLVTP